MCAITGKLAERQFPERFQHIYLSLDFGTFSYHQQMFNPSRQGHHQVQQKQEEEKHNSLCMGVLGNICIYTPHTHATIYIYIQYRYMYVVYIYTHAYIDINVIYMYVYMYVCICVLFVCTLCVPYVCVGRYDMHQNPGLHRCTFPVLHHDEFRTEVHQEPGAGGICRINP